MKKLLAIITCIVVLILGSSFSVFASSDTPTLTVGQVTAEGGASVEVPITISDNTGVCGATIMVTYDDRLKLTAVSAGEGLSTLTMTKPGDLTQNPVNILWDGTDADNSNGDIVKLSFTVPKAAGIYPVSVNYTSGDIVDGNLEPVNPQIVNGSITVQSQEMKDQEVAKEAEAVINNMDPADKESVAAARAAYDTLTDNQKALVDAAVLAKLTDAEKAFADAEAQEKADQKAADDVVKLINAIDPGNRETVEIARAAYDALTDVQKALVSADAYKRLTDTEAAIQALDEQQAQDQKVADDVAALINAIETGDRETVAAARAAYDALDDVQKALVDPEVLKKLTDAETAIIEEDNKLKTDQEAADDVIEAISTMNPGDKDNVVAVRTAYEALTEDQKALIDEETLKILTEAEDAIQQAEESGKKDIRGEGIMLEHEAEWNGGEAVRPYDNWIMRRSDYSFLYEGQDYEVTYDNNYERGTATATIKGVGDYTGEITAEFEVVPYDLEGILDPYDEFFMLETSKFTYNGKAKDVVLVTNFSTPTTLVKDVDYTVTYPDGNKTVGKHTAKVVCKGNYKGEGEFTFTIVPKGTSISKLTRGWKSFTAKWKKQSTQTSGYQIQYSLKKNFKSAKTVTVKKNKTVSKKIKKLKSKKTYYVRVRTYKTVSGKKYYSSWSKAKAVKTR